MRLETYDLLRLDRVVGLVVALLLLGCASQTVRVTSDPPHARVTIGNKVLTTPDDIMLPPGKHVAQFVFDGDDAGAVEATVRVEDGFRRTGRTIGQFSSYAFKGVSAPFLFVGCLSGAMFSPAPGGTTYQLSSDSSPEEAYVMLVGIGGFMIGMPLYWIGDYLDDVSYASPPVLHGTRRASASIPD